MQAAIRAKLARTPLYAYTQLQSNRGVHKQSARAMSSAAVKPGKVGAKENAALRWFGSLDGSRARKGQRLSLSAAPVKAKIARKSM